MNDLNASLDNLKTRYREIFQKSVDEIQKRIDEIKPDIDGDILTNILLKVWAENGKTLLLICLKMIFLKIYM